MSQNTARPLSTLAKHQNTSRGIGKMQENTNTDGFIDIGAKDQKKSLLSYNLVFNLMLTFPSWSSPSWPCPSWGYRAGGPRGSWDGDTSPLSRGWINRHVWKHDILIVLRSAVVNMYSQVDVVFHESHPGVARPTLLVVITDDVFVVRVWMFRQVALYQIPRLLRRKSTNKTIPSVSTFFSLFNSSRILGVSFQFFLFFFFQ